MQKHQKIAYAGPKASPKSSICQRMIACATPAIRKKNKHEKKMDKGVQNPGFEIVREESVKVYLHMHNGNVRQNPLCVESCVTNGFSISYRLSPTRFDPDASSVLLRAHLCTA